MSAKVVLRIQAEKPQPIRLSGKRWKPVPEARPFRKAPTPKEAFAEHSPKAPRRPSAIRTRSSTSRLIGRLHRTSYFPRLSGVSNKVLAKPRNRRARRTARHPASQRQRAGLAPRWRTLPKCGREKRRSSYRLQMSGDGRNSCGHGGLPGVALQAKPSDWLRFQPNGYCLRHGYQ